MSMAAADKVAVYLVGHDPKIVLLNNTGCLFEHGRGQDTDTGVLGGVGKIAVCGGIHEHLLILGTQGLGKLIKRRNYAG